MGNQLPPTVPHVEPLSPESYDFFDTNFLALPGSVLPILPDSASRDRWITETVEQEAFEKLDPALRAEKNLSMYKVLRFDELYERDTNICPTFYWYILAMYNPANLASEDFVEELVNSRVLKGEAITAEVRSALAVHQRQSSAGKSLDPLGRPKADELKRLERLSAGTAKKGRKSIRDGHPAFIRDIKNLALILYHSLSSRKDITFYTTDGDPSSLLLRWLDSVVTRWQLMVEILSRLQKEDHEQIVKGENVDVLIDYETFARQKSTLYSEFVSNRWKPSGVTIRVRRWNQTELKFETDVYLTFTPEMAEQVSTMHGSLVCPPSANATFGNWLRLNYHWPPQEADGLNIRVELTRKPHIQRESTLIGASAHNDNCRYRREDKSGEIKSWSEFI